jgi:peptidoglycan/LPS O-acetylase OafA/YrhL
MIFKDLERFCSISYQTDDLPGKNIVTKLSDYSEGGRFNNFNLMRLLAAMAVLLSHSYALAIGSSKAEPLGTSLGVTFGSMAVDFFFIISGFLVTGSLLAKRNLLQFAWARVLRIYPAIVVVVLLSVFVLGLFFTTYPPASFLLSKETHIYLIKNTTIATGAAYTLPGVFGANPYKNSVNGSLWTLPYEVRLYIALGILWAVLGIARNYRLRAFKCSVVSLALISALALIAEHFHFMWPSKHIFLRLFCMFFTGAAYYVLKERVIMSKAIFLFCLSAILLSAFTNKDLFFLTYSLLSAYVLFFLAYVPSGRIRFFNSLGDYSYGTYIYAFPVQQAAAACIPGISVAGMFAVSFPVTLLLAVLSWHLVEKRALQLKSSLPVFVKS